jgi:DNA-binding response OmpR family regulator
MQGMVDSPPPPARVLVVDDDEKLASLLRTYLAQRGMQLEIASDGEAALRMLSTRPFDVVVLDVMLPGADGFEVCKRIRARSQIPIVMLTARGEDSDRILGLELGADDYLPKPFNPRELVARLQAVLRRATPRGADGRGGEVISAGEVRVDVPGRRVWVEGAEIVVTAYEFELLRLLVTNAGRVLSRDELLDRLKGEEYDSFDRSIDVHISKLRQKVERDPQAPRRIKTVRGVGYVFAVEEPAGDASARRRRGG